MRRHPGCRKKRNGEEDHDAAAVDEVDIRTLKALAREKTKRV
jgi:hypothetical protein